MRAKTLNENLGYTNFFGKKVSHEEELQSMIRNRIIHIITEEREISEKAFQKYDSVMEEVRNLCKNNPKIYEMAEEYYRSGKRLELLAEEIYDNLIK